MNQYQLIVIGAGPGGYQAAIKAAQLGLKTALIENRQVGGTCLNRGCIPTKALLHASGLYAKAVNEFESIGLSAENVSFDIKKVHERKDEVVLQLRSGVEQLIKANKIDLYNGTGRITGPHDVTVKTAEEEIKITSDDILIATGSNPAIPPIEGTDLPNVGTSDDYLTTSDNLPKNMLILGGGVIGVEFACIYQSLGCNVTLLVKRGKVLYKLDKEICRNLEMILKKRGVKIYNDSMSTKIEKTETGLRCYFNQKGKDEEQFVDADGILMAIGRKANTEGLFGDDFSVDMTEGGKIITDDEFRTNVPSIRAIGDVMAKYQLAHFASAQGICAVEMIAGKEPTIDLNAVPDCVYTDPEIASVGMTEDQAKEAGIPVKKGKYLMSGNGKSIIEQSDRGFIKVVFNAETNVIIGAQLMCCRATDLISEFATAIVNKLTQEQLASVIRPHPTFTEAVTEAVESVNGMAIHMAPVKR